MRTHAKKRINNQLLEVRARTLLSRGISNKTFVEHWNWLIIALGSYHKKICMSLSMVDAIFGSTVGSHRIANELRRNKFSSPAALLLTLWRELSFKRLFLSIFNLQLWETLDLKIEYTGQGGGLSDWFTRIYRLILAEQFCSKIEIWVAIQFAGFSWACNNNKTPRVRCKRFTVCPQRNIAPWRCTRDFGEKICRHEYCSPRYTSLTANPIPKRAANLRTVFYHLSLAADHPCVLSCSLS